MNDWERFIAHTPWFIQPGETAVVGDEYPWSRDPLESLPRLSTLLRTASLTPVSRSGRPYELIAWGPVDNRRGWLCDPPPTVEPVGVHPIHRQFWSVCGGIVERFGDPDSWWLNMNDVLTVEATTLSPAQVIDEYRWIWENDGLEVPGGLDGYYPVAIEANGNLFLAHRRTGALIIFGPDHAYPGVTPLPGCPEYSLMTIDDLPDLASWIEACAY
jgi:hypothetical protein